MSIYRAATRQSAPGDVRFPLITNARSLNCQKVAERACSDGERDHGRGGGDFAGLYDHTIVIASDNTPHIPQGGSTLMHVLWALHGISGTPPASARAILAK